LTETKIPSGDTLFHKLVKRWINRCDSLSYRRKEFHREKKKKKEEKKRERRFVLTGTKGPGVAEIKNLTSANWKRIENSGGYPIFGRKRRERVLTRGLSGWGKLMSEDFRRREEVKKQIKGPNFLNRPKSLKTRESTNPYELLRLRKDAFF